MIHNDSKNDAPVKRRASLGEKGLFLINNDKEWEQLKQEMRASGCVTNGAARLMIMEYLLQMPDPNEEVITQSHDDIDVRPSLFSMDGFYNSARSACAKIKKRPKSHNGIFNVIGKKHKEKKAVYLICTSH